MGGPGGNGAPDDDADFQTHSYHLLPPLRAPGSPIGPLLGPPPGPPPLVGEFEGAGRPPPPPSAMPRMMTDTAEYCDILRTDIARVMARHAQMPLPPDAAMLVQEGEHMCEIGHFRPGIYRLRTALRMLRHPY